MTTDPSKPMTDSDRSSYTAEILRDDPNDDYDDGDDYALDHNDEGM